MVLFCPCWNLNHIVDEKILKKINKNVSFWASWKKITWGWVIFIFGWNIPLSGIWHVVYPNYSQIYLCSHRFHSNVQVPPYPHLFLRTLMSIPLSDSRLLIWTYRICTIPFSPSVAPWETESPHNVSKSIIPLFSFRLLFTFKDSELIRFKIRCA